MERGPGGEPGRPDAGAYEAPAGMVPGAGGAVPPGAATGPSGTATASYARAPVPVPSRARPLPSAGLKAGSSRSASLITAAGGVPDGEPGLFSSSGGAAGGRGRGFRDRTGEVHDVLVVLGYLGVDRHGESVWRCRCTCGRDDCRGEVERHSCDLRKPRFHWCGGMPRTRYIAPAPRPRPIAHFAVPEGVRPPWERSAERRRRRDGELAFAFAAGRPDAMAVPCGPAARDPSSGGRG